MAKPTLPKKGVLIPPASVAPGDVVRFKKPITEGTVVFVELRLNNCGEWVEVIKVSCYDEHFERLVHCESAAVKRN